METQKIRFSHEKLEVYQRALKFISWLDEIILKAEKNRNVIDQIDKASISIVLNIAEGNGKSSNKDHNRFLEIARGSALECAACIDVMYAKRMILLVKAEDGKEQLEVVVKMLFKLSQRILNSISENPLTNLSPNLSQS